MGWLLNIIYLGTAPFLSSTSVISLHQLPFLAFPQSAPGCLWCCCWKFSAFIKGSAHSCVWHQDDVYCWSAVRLLRSCSRLVFFWILLVVSHGSSLCWTNAHYWFFSIYFVMKNKMICCWQGTVYSSKLRRQDPLFNIKARSSLETSFICLIFFFTTVPVFLTWFWCFLPVLRLNSI